MPTDHTHVCVLRHITHTYTHLFRTRTLSSRHYYYLSFTDEETEADRASDPSQITQLLSGATCPQTQALGLEAVLSARGDAAATVEGSSASGVLSPARVAVVILVAEPGADVGHMTWLQVARLPA